MKYQATILIDNQIYTQLQNGTLRLQCGQWIQLAWCDKPSRWVGLTKSGTLWAVHYPVRLDKFKALCVNIDRFKHSPKKAQETMESNRS
jgi:hypothetical protein